MERPAAAEDGGRHEHKWLKEILLNKETQREETDKQGKSLGDNAKSKKTEAVGNTLTTWNSTWVILVKECTKTS